MTINIKRLICELWEKSWCWCDAYWDWVDVCTETRQLANPYCPVERVRLRKKERPQATCTEHEAPQPPLPKWKVCRDTGLEATKWCPSIDTVYTEPSLACRRHGPPKPSKKDADFVIFSFDPWRHDVTDDELESAVVRAGEAGCDYDRTFLGWPGDGRVRMQPFLSAGTGAVLPWDVYQFNPDWVVRLRKFQRMLAKAGMGIMMDFFGLQVAQMKDIVPYAWFVQPNNRNDIDGYRDVRPHAMDYWRWCMAQVMSMVGAEGNLIKLGNEQRAPGDGGSEENAHTVEILKWAKAWALPLAQYARNDLKVRLPVSAVAEPYHGTGHCIASVLSDAGWAWPEFVGHWHGCDLYENWAKRWIVPNPDGGEWHMWAVPKYYAISDDGGGRDMPVAKRGMQNPSNPTRWSANQHWRIDTVRRIREKVRHVRFIEWMPMEFKSDTCRPGDLDQTVSVDVYWRCAQELWGIDIRRSL